jgi:hydroxymethylpyrimidine/phosphomethylpyrimidine kinase
MGEDDAKVGVQSHDASETVPGAPVVAIGGLDPSGGAGLVRDFLTAEALGSQAFLIGTAFTLQVTGRDGARLMRTEPRSPSELAQDLAAAVAAVRPAAVKVGMVATGGLAAAIVDGLAGFTGPVVFDPVLGASAGGALYTGDLAELGPLLARATLVTPNLAEAGLLSDMHVHDRPAAAAAAQVILREGAAAVLVKGGHLPGDADDLLITPTTSRTFTAPRLPGKSPRGTGCALATAIAINLGRGQSLESAIAAAKHWLHGAIARSRNVGLERHL